MPGPQPTDPRPRKVLFISADQWRAECLSAVGHPVVKTPHLDALAADGTLFRQHYTVCAPCGPARTSLHTGLYLMNHRSGRNGTPLDSRHTNLAKEARKAGYDPTLYGYTDTSADPRGRHPNDPALKTYEGPMPGYHVGLLFHDYMAAWMNRLRDKGYAFAGRGDVYRPRDDVAVPPGRGYRYRPTLFRAEDSDTNFMADLVIDWLTGRRGQNWFLHCVFLRPHPPVVAPEPYNALYDPASVPFPARRPTPEAEAAQHPLLQHWIERFGNHLGYDEHNPLNLVTMPEPELRQMRACYYGMINEVDDAVGRLIAHLKASGEYDDTLIVFSCDHGEMGGDHYTWGKELYFDPSFRIPLILRDPRRAADAGRGKQVDAFTESVDLMPTILDWLGLEPPAECDGRSLLPFLEGETPEDWRQEAHMELDFRTTPNLEGFDAEAALGLRPDDCQLAILRGKRWKYVHFAALPPLLFDLENDPDEMTDLARDPEHQAVMLDCAQRMLSWRMRHAERTLTNLHLWRDGVIDRRVSR
ncbi:MAG TPA: alkaline phosphatase family protein [Candidatus Cybelea sp.]|nr:alkaline phosphatase family protein [Candidatus Cybelea sp.]